MRACKYVHARARVGMCVRVSHAVWVLCVLCVCVCVFVCVCVCCRPMCVLCRGHECVSTLCLSSITVSVSQAISLCLSLALSVDRLAGLVVKASASPRFDSRLRRDFFRVASTELDLYRLVYRAQWSRHTSDLSTGTPVATLQGAWRYRVSTGTGWPCVSILWLGEVESLICSFYLSVAARTIVWADPSLRYSSMLLGR